MQTKSSLVTPILFLVFNRPEPTKAVFAAIREAKPKKLYVAADGPRDSKSGEQEKVKAIRDFISSNIDWDCELVTLFREENLGCKYAVSGAITWFFEHEPMGIILEDDCLPNQSFFKFCSSLLSDYENDRRIWQIGGNNFGLNSSNKSEDYLYTRIPQIWGWATWRSRWQFYDAELANIEHIFNHKNAISKSLGLSRVEFDLMAGRYRKAANKIIDTWDYQWHATVIMNNGLCVLPTKNLISNLGDGDDATHTVQDASRTHLKTEELNFPLRITDHFMVDLEAQEYMKGKMRLKVSPTQKAIYFLKKYLLGHDV
ncbi:nucleotide-diphospho-sugar transferase [Gammaproteobacteria bacterium]|nr:nucleotide-diphospho-sugar transferase [Gammaproteobacteria bacterium]